VDEKRRMSGKRCRKLTDKRFMGKALMKSHSCNGLMVNERVYILWFWRIETSLEKKRWWGKREFEMAGRRGGESL